MRNAFPEQVRHMQRFDADAGRRADLLRAQHRLVRGQCFPFQPLKKCQGRRFVLMLPVLAPRPRRGLMRLIVRPLRRDHRRLGGQVALRDPGAFVLGVQPSQFVERLALPLQVPNARPQRLKL